MSGCGDSIDGDEAADREEMRRPVTEEWLREQLTKVEGRAPEAA